jgi:hypothetical protein
VLEYPFYFSRLRFPGAADFLADVLNSGCRTLILIRRGTMPAIDINTILHTFAVVLGVGALILAFDAKAQLERLQALVGRL